MVGTHRNHRLDGNDHAGLEANASPLLSIVRNVGVLVHHAANAMAHIVTKHAIAVRLGEGLNSITNIPDMITGNSLLNGSLKAIARNLAQGLGLGRGGADEKRPSVIADPTVDNGSRIDGDDIAIAQDHVGVGNTMDHGIVDRCANGPREPAVTLKGRGAAMHADNLLRELIELKSRNAGAHHGSNVAERHLR